MDDTPCELAAAKRALLKEGSLDSVDRSYFDCWTIFSASA
jgi:hypothetical protein